jgi:aldehyde:ferredoxin oxidoreductase
MARTALNRERQFNRNAGLTQASDRLPEFFYEETLPPFNTVFDIDTENVEF